MSYQLQVKGVTDEIKERLAASAERNFRSLNQEALARIQFSFEIEDSLRSKTLQKMIDEGKYSVDSDKIADRLVDEHMLIPD